MSTGRPPTVTLHLNRLTFEQAIRLIAGAYRLTYIVRDGTYVVRQLAPASNGLILPQGAQDLPLELRAYPLRHARAEDVAAALTKAIGAFAGTQANGPSSQPASPPTVVPTAPAPLPPVAPSRGTGPPSGGPSYGPPPSTPPPPVPVAPPGLEVAEARR